MMGNRIEGQKTVMRRVMWSTVVVIGLSASVVSAQRPAETRRPGAAETNEAAAAQQRLREARYQIGQMERLLEGAVEHGAEIIRDRLQAIMPADMLLTENARARGFRLDGYGVFFDVEVPDLGGTIWSYQSLDRNDLGLEAALQTLRQAAGNDVDAQQALRRVELQVSPAGRLSSGSAGVAGAVQTGSSAPAADQPAAAPRTANDPVLNNPDEAYRTEIREALMDAMLEHSRSLSIGPSEHLTVAARRTDDRPRLSIDTDARTVVLSVRGSDLMAFLGGQLTPQEARARIEVRVF